MDERSNQNIKINGRIGVCKNRSLQRRTGRSLEIKLQIGRKSIWTGSIKEYIFQYNFIVCRNTGIAICHTKDCEVH